MIPALFFFFPSSFRTENKREKKRKKLPLWLFPFRAKIAGSLPFRLSGNNNVSQDFTLLMDLPRLFLLEFVGIWWRENYTCYTSPGGRPAGNWFWSLQRCNEITVVVWPAIKVGWWMVLGGHCSSACVFRCCVISSEVCIVHLADCLCLRVCVCVCVGLCVCVLVYVSLCVCVCTNLYI